MFGFKSNPTLLTDVRELAFGLFCISFVSLQCPALYLLQAPFTLLGGIKMKHRNFCLCYD